MSARTASSAIGFAWTSERIASRTPPPPAPSGRAAARPSCSSGMPEPAVEPGASALAHVGPEYVPRSVSDVLEAVGRAEGGVARPRLADQPGGLGLVGLLAARLEVGP